MKTKVFLFLGMVALLFAGCKKEDIAENVYLQKAVLKATVGSMSTTLTNEYVWENGMIVMERNSTILFGTTTNEVKYYEYEGENLVHTYTVRNDGDTVLPNYYTYENNRLKTITTNGSVSTITGYGPNGEITSYEYVSTITSAVQKYELGWKDGDVITCKVTTIVDGDTISVKTDTCTFDDKPSIYSHFPVAMTVEGTTMPLRASKHNQLMKGYSIEYKNDRLVRKVSDDGNTELLVYYTDGVGPDEK